MAMTCPPRTRSGFLLPVLLLVLSLCGVLALSMVASATLDTRASEAAWFRRLAFEAAEDALAFAVRESPRRTAPWEAAWTTGQGVRVQVRVRPLGQWPTIAGATPGATPGTTAGTIAGTTAGTTPGTDGAIPEEQHERAIAVARAGRGATMQLEQDFAYLPASSGTPASPAQPTVWRSVETTP